MIFFFSSILNGIKQRTTKNEQNVRHFKRAVKKKQFFTNCRFITA